jgi:opacity protein-like surface antigen
MDVKKVGLMVMVMMALLTIPASAASNVGFNGIGGRLFYADFEGSSAIGVGAVVKIAEFNKNLQLEGNVDLWSKTYGSGDVEVKLRDLALGGTVKYYFTTSSPAFKPFVNGGLALHFLSTEVPEITVLGIKVGGGSVSDTKIGFDLGGGVAYALNPTTDLVANIMYRIVSDTNQLFIGAGFLINL